MFLTGHSVVFTGWPQMGERREPPTPTRRWARKHGAEGRMSVSVQLHFRIGRGWHSVPILRSARRQWRPSCSSSRDWATAQQRSGIRADLLHGNRK